MDDIVANAVKLTSRILWTVTSDGRSRTKLIRDIERKKGVGVSVEAQEIRFYSTSGATYQLVGIRGDEFEDDKRNIFNVYKEANRRGYLQPDIEVAFLLREKYPTEEELGFSFVVVCHEPIWTPDTNWAPGERVLLSLERRELYGIDRNWLHTYEMSIVGYISIGLFIFLAPEQVSNQS